MTSKSADETTFFDSSNFLAYFLKWRKPILILTLSAAVLSTIVTYFIEPKYKSTVILYPTTTVSISKTLLKDWDDVLKFGEEKEAEQLLQILNSDYVREKIAERYNLAQHYKIDAKSPFKKLYLKLEFDDRVYFQRTPYNSIEISVLDRSADTAAFVANDIANLIDSLKNKLYKERALQALKIVSDEYNLKAALVKKLEDSLVVFTKQGFFDYEDQSAIIFKEYSRAIRGNNAAAENKLDQKLKVLGDHGWAYVALRDNAYYERNQMFALKTKYDQARVDVEKFLPSKYIINPAFPAEKKTYPVRWIIVLVSSITTLLLSIILITAMEKWKSSALFAQVMNKG